MSPGVPPPAQRQETTPPAGADRDEGRPGGQDRAWAAEVPEAAWQEAVAALRRVGDARGRIVLACHADPDGDALGSMLALHLCLRRRGYRTVASWGSQPFQVPPQYTFLPGLGTLSPPRDVPSHTDLLVTVDAASTERLGLLEPLADTAGTVLVIDHHASNPGFGDINLVASKAAATAMLVEELIGRLGEPVDKAIATCLYVALVTDTGRFQHPSTDPAAMQLGGRLLGHGIAHEELNRQMFETHSFGYLKLLGRVLDRAEFLPDASLVWSLVRGEDLEDFGVALEETEGIIDLLRTAESAEVAMILKQAGHGRWRVSLRSTGEIDVGALATELGGGGHPFSAGFATEGDPGAVVERVRERLA